MTIDIYDFSFHDSKIFEVRELSEHQIIEFYIDFQVNWEENQFEKRTLRFINVTKYSIDAFPFAGYPTILNINKLSDNSIEILTNADTRTIEYERVELTL